MKFHCTLKSIYVWPIDKTGRNKLSVFLEEEFLCWIYNKKRFWGVKTRTKECHYMRKAFGCQPVVVSHTQCSHRINHSYNEVIMRMHFETYKITLLNLVNIICVTKYWYIKIKRRHWISMEQKKNIYTKESPTPPIFNSMQSIEKDHHKVLTMRFVCGNRTKRKTHKNYKNYNIVIRLKSIIFMSWYPICESVPCALINH